jgi:hypothetical protein
VERRSPSHLFSLSLSRYVCLHYTLNCDGECIKCVVLDGERGCGGAAAACTLLKREGGTRRAENVVAHAGSRAMEMSSALEETRSTWSHNKFLCALSVSKNQRAGNFKQEKQTTLTRPPPRPRINEMHELLFTCNRIEQLENLMQPLTSEFVFALSYYFFNAIFRGNKFICHFSVH